MLKYNMDEIKVLDDRGLKLHERQNEKCNTYNNTSLMSIINFIKLKIYSINIF